MTKILYTVLTLFLTVALSAQFTDRPGKIQLGYQTTANGLVCLVDSIPAFTPSDQNDCYLAQDTVANKIYIYKPSLASWVEFSSGIALIDSIENVLITSPVNGQVLRYDGTKWINSTERDTSDINEIQYLVFSGDTLSLTDDPTSVILPYLEQSEISSIISDSISLIVMDSTRLLQDSILVYFQAGSEIGRDTLSLSTPETDPIYAADSAALKADISANAALTLQDVTDNGNTTTNRIFLETIDEDNTNTSLLAADPVTGEVEKVTSADNLSLGITTNYLPYWDGNSWEDTDYTYISGIFAEGITANDSTKLAQFGFIDGALNNTGGAFLQMPGNSYSDSGFRGDLILNASTKVNSDAAILFRADASTGSGNIISLLESKLSGTTIFNRLFLETIDQDNTNTSLLAADPVTGEVEERTVASINSGNTLQSVTDNGNTTTNGIVTRAPEGGTVGLSVQDDNGNYGLAVRTTTEGNFDFVLETSTGDLYINTPSSKSLFVNRNGIGVFEFDDDALKGNNTQNGNSSIYAGHLDYLGFNANNTLMPVMSIGDNYNAYTDYGVRLYYNNAAGLQNAIEIDTTGYIGIGTTSPDAELEVVGEAIIPTFSGETTFQDRIFLETIDQDNTNTSLLAADPVTGEVEKVTSADNLSLGITTNYLPYWDGNSWEDTDYTYISGIFAEGITANDSTKLAQFGFIDGALNNTGGAFLQMPGNSYSDSGFRGDLILNASTKVNSDAAILFRADASTGSGNIISLLESKLSGTTIFNRLFLETIDQDNTNTSLLAADPVTGEVEEVTIVKTDIDLTANTLNSDSTATAINDSDRIYIEQGGDFKEMAGSDFKNEVTTASNQRQYGYNTANDVDLNLGTIFSSAPTLMEYNVSANCSLSFASSDTQITLPTPSVTYANRRISIAANDANVTYDVTVGAGTDEIWNAGSTTNSVTLADGETAVFVCMQQASDNAWIWFKF